VGATIDVGKGEIISALMEKGVPSSFDHASRYEI
jgi:hypothetical protein